jgi:hypothetical protein
MQLDYHQAPRAAHTVPAHLPEHHGQREKQSVGIYRTNPLVVKEQKNIPLLTASRHKAQVLV